MLRASVRRCVGTISSIVVQSSVALVSVGNRGSTASLKMGYPPLCFRGVHSRGFSFSSRASWCVRVVLIAVLGVAGCYCLLCRGGVVDGQSSRGSQFSSLFGAKIPEYSLGARAILPLPTGLKAANSRLI